VLIYASGASSNRSREVALPLDLELEMRGSELLVLLPELLVGHAKLFQGSAELLQCFLGSDRPPTSQPIEPLMEALQPGAELLRSHRRDFSVFSPTRSNSS
jgi:hypothetical protein